MIIQPSVKVESDQILGCRAYVTLVAGHVVGLGQAIFEAHGIAEQVQHLLSCCK